MGVGAGGFAHGAEDALAHELRTPLTVIIGMLELLQAGRCPAAERDALIETVLLHAHDLTATVDRLLAGG